MSMHKVEFGLVELALDAMKFAIGRITNPAPALGSAMSEAELQQRVGETITPRGIGGEVAMKLFQDVLLKATVAIDHPRHLAFVPANPTRASVLFDLVTSAASVHGAYWLEGGGAIFAENQTARWLVRLTGLPETAVGVFTPGGTLSNLSGLVAAREKWRQSGPGRADLKALVVCGASAHSSVKAMARVMDCDVHTIDTQERLTGRHVGEALHALTPAQRGRVCAVVATAGTTNAGLIDELDGIASVCAAESVWFHVDAAYGGGALLAKSVRAQFNGIENADSITIDPHKWLFAPYDCGAILYREPKWAKQAHAQGAPYLDVTQHEGANGFNPAEYQIQLTRRVRGLPLWFSLAMHGTDRYAEAVERGLWLAQRSAELIRGSAQLELVREPSLSCVLFRRKGWSEADYFNWTLANHRAGLALVTPTRWRQGQTLETVLRFCFINPDTSEADIQLILDSTR